MVYPVEIPDPSLRKGALLAAASLAVIFSLAAFVGYADTDAVEIDSLVYINRDPVESLMRLPGIGVDTAASVIEYRNASMSSKAFESTGDLCKVKGIAQKKAQNIEPYVSFE